MKRINTILWSEEPPENTNTLWLNDGILYYYNDGWEAISDISKYIESLAKSADRITAASNKIFSVNNMLSNNADLIVSNVQKLESSSDSISQSTEILATVSQQLTDSAEDVISGANTIKDKAEVLQENADKIEQAVEPLVQASESLDATKQAFEMLSSEWADGRQAIATALTNRRYPTEPTESFHAMAQKITDMNYEEGWFAKLGYDANDFGGILDAINFTFELSKAWDTNGSTPTLFKSSSLVFFPKVNYTNVLLLNLFNACTSLVNALDIDAPNTTNWGGLFSNCSSLFYVGVLNSPKATSFFGLFSEDRNLRIVKSVDLTSATNCSNIVNNCVSLVYARFLNLGKPQITTYDFSGATVWGTGGEENRQSLIDSLITYSYDRASAGMSTVTIKLSANTKALLTEEEIAQITAKGFTIA